MKNLKGKKFVITSDNENYTEFLNDTLICTDSYNKGSYYDESMYPMLLCEFKTLSGKIVPFALYEYEFKQI